MNLLDILSQHLRPISKDVATIADKKANGQLIAQTLGGGVVILAPNAGVAVGQKVYYNRITGEIIAVAPEVEFKRWGI